MAFTKDPYLILGGVFCEVSEVPRVADDIRALKQKHGIARHTEVKWTKASGSKKEFYEQLIDYFFAESALRARVVIAKRVGLNHTKFGQSEDDWYYKMYYQLILRIAEEADCRVFLDIKDTKSAEKNAKLQTILQTKLKNPGSILLLQAIRSHEVQLMQLVDVLIGAMNYALRELNHSPGKLYILEALRRHIGDAVERGTPLRERKLNIFHWSPQ